VSLSILIITGQSGSGKSTVIRTLEDHGYFCVDNIPPSLAEPLLERAKEDSEVTQIGLVMDIRSPHFVEQAPALVERMRAATDPLRVLYLEATDAALVKRYSETRRKHPLDNGCGLREAIDNERRILIPLRELADDTLNTSEMSPHVLRSRVVEQIVHVKPGDNLQIGILSFGFKNGVPLDADIVLDVRFLPNPYFDEGLRHQNGLNKQVRDFVLLSDEGQKFLEKAETFLSFLIPRYQGEGRRYLTVAVGCTGGQHRSVAVSEALAMRLEARGLKIDRRHRDMQELPT